MALEMASLGNELCANCIGTLSFPIDARGGPSDCHRQLEYMIQTIS